MDNEGSDGIAPVTIKGNYNGPALWLPDMIHDFEITEMDYDEMKSWSV